MGGASLSVVCVFCDGDGVTAITLVVPCGRSMGVNRLVGGSSLSMTIVVTIGGGVVDSNVCFGMVV